MQRTLKHAFSTQHACMLQQSFITSHAACCVIAAFCFTNHCPHAFCFCVCARLPAHETPNKATLHFYCCFPVNACIYQAIGGSRQACKKCSFIYQVLLLQCSKTLRVARKPFYAKGQSLKTLHVWCRYECIQRSNVKQCMYLHAFCNLVLLGMCIG